MKRIGPQENQNSERRLRLPCLRIHAMQCKGAAGIRAASDIAWCPPISRGYHRIARRLAKEGQ